MTIQEIVHKLGLSVHCCGNQLNREVTGGYSGDLLSDVMANTKSGNIWITMQTHVNIVAVAVLKELSGIILVNGRKPDAETQHKAEQEHLPILLSSLSSFEVAGKLYFLGVRHVT